MDESNLNLRKAKATRNDEFYTTTNNLGSDLSICSWYLSGKIVYCNCDNANSSEIVKFLLQNFKSIGIKKLYVSGLGDFFSVTEDGYDGLKTHRLVGGGSFYSQECLSLLKKCDVVVTNPPFSKFNEFISKLIDFGKKFFVMGNLNAATNKIIFPKIKTGEISVINSKTKKFNTPDGEKSINNVVWFTNIPNIEKPRLSLSCSIYDYDYQKYDNINAINVPNLKLIPNDYSGVMGVPITFLPYYDNKEFNILGCMYNAKIKGKKVYQRIMIQNKILHKINFPDIKEMVSECVDKILREVVSVNGNIVGPVYHCGDEASEDKFSDVMWFSDKPIDRFGKRHKYMLDIRKPLVIPSYFDGWCDKLWHYCCDEDGNPNISPDDPKLTKIFPAVIWKYIQECDNEIEVGDIPYIVKNMAKDGVLDYDSVIIRGIGETEACNVSVDDYVVFSIKQVIPCD